MTESLFYTMLEISVSVSAVVLLIFLLTPLLKKYFAAKWLYWIWLVLAVRLLVPVNVHMPQPAVRLQIPQQTVSVNAAGATPSRRAAVPSEQEAVAPAGTEAPASPQAARPDAARNVTVPELLAAVWLAGMAVFLLSRFAAYFTFLRMVRRWSRPVREPELHGELRRQEEELGIRRSPVFLRCKKIASPMMAGFFRPMLLLPETDLSEEELRLILKHELIHWKRKDVWFKLLLCAANAVHWFNPVVWMMARRAGEDAELVCDSEVVRGFGTDYRRQYGETILSSANRSRIRGASFSTYFCGSAKTLKQRLANILDIGKKRRGVAAFCAVLAAASVLGIFIACGEVKQESAPNPQEPIDNISQLGYGNSFAIENGKLMIRFGKDKSEIAAPISLQKEYPSASPSAGSVYISDKIAAIAYGSDSREGVNVTFTHDRGKTWNTSHVAAYEEETTWQYFVGFTTENDGWLVTMGGTTEGYAKNRVFQTGDGGKTWSEIGNASKVYPHVVTGAGFADADTGFISFRYDTEINPVVFRTGDKGKTWSKCSLSIPGTMLSTTAYATALSPVFHGADGVLPVDLMGIYGEVVSQIRYVTADYGKTWVYRKMDSAPAPSAGSSSATGGAQKMKKITAGDYEIKIPILWDCEQAGSPSSLTFLKDNREIGLVGESSYDPLQPISQLEGNHAETLTSKKLTGMIYPAEEDVIRRTQPAAAGDSSFADELHIYILPEGSRIAYDLNFDSAQVTEKTAFTVAESFLLSGDAEAEAAYGDISVTGRTLCGSFGTVVCGSLKSDPKQGVAVVIWNSKNSNAEPKRYLTPEKHGAIKADVSNTAKSAKEDVFHVAAEDGYTWLFDMYNGFENGRHGASGTAKTNS